MFNVRRQSCLLRNKSRMEAFFASAVAFFSATTVATISSTFLSSRTTLFRLATFLICCRLLLGHHRGDHLVHFPLVENHLVSLGHLLDLLSPSSRPPPWRPSRPLSSRREPPCFAWPPS